MSGEHERLRELAKAATLEEGVWYPARFWETFIDGDDDRIFPDVDGKYLEAVRPSVIVGLLDQIEALQARLRFVMPAVNDRLKADGSHNALPDGYCPDCGGGCLRAFVGSGPCDPFVEPSPFAAPGQVAAFDEAPR